MQENLNIFFDPKETTRLPVGIRIDPSFFSDQALSKILRDQIFNSNPRTLTLLFEKHRPIFFTSDELKSYASLPEEKREDTINCAVSLLRNAVRIFINEKVKPTGKPSAMPSPTIPKKLPPPTGI